MTIRCHHFRIGVAFSDLSTSLLGAMAAAALAYLGGLNPATALAYNLRRALNIVGVGAMIATVRG